MVDIGNILDNREDGPNGNANGEDSNIDPNLASERQAGADLLIPGSNPTILNYNASVVKSKIYST
jgi:hypothetical protein